MPSMDATREEDSWPMRYQGNNCYDTNTAAQSRGDISFSFLLQLNRLVFNVLREFDKFCLRRRHRGKRQARK